MGDLINVNNRNCQMRTSQYQSVSNPWAYSLFNASPSVMYPETNDSAYWDKQRFNFGGDATSYLNNSAALNEQLMPQLRDWQAGIAKQFQEIMMQIQGGNCANGVNGANGVNIDVNETASATSTGVNKLKEGKIIETLNKMGADSGIKDRFNKEITIKDKDGNEQKTTLLRRLIELSKEYQENPDDCELSTGNYRLIWDIAGKYAETGELTTEDYKILLEIAKNPGGTKADEDDKDKVKEKPHAEKRTSEKITSLIDDFVNGIENGGYWGTDKAKIANALDPNTGISKDNILEVLDGYKKTIRNHPNEKQDLISGILDDFGGWGDGDASWWSMKMSSDDAKPRLEAIKEALVNRAKAFVKEHGEDKGVTKEDIENFKLPESRNDEAIKTMFNDFIAKLAAAESSVYGEDEAH